MCQEFKPKMEKTLLVCQIKTGLRTPGCLCARVHWGCVVCSSCRPNVFEQPPVESYSPFLGHIWEDFFCMFAFQCVPSQTWDIPSQVPFHHCQEPKAAAVAGAAAAGATGATGAAAAAGGAGGAVAAGPKGGKAMGKGKGKAKMKAKAKPRAAF